MAAKRSTSCLSTAAKRQLSQHETNITPSRSKRRFWSTLNTRLSKSRRSSRCRARPPAPRRQARGTARPFSNQCATSSKAWASAPTIQSTAATAANIVENLQRADITPLEEGRAFQRVLDTGVTAEELAQRLGLKQAWRITDRTALLRLNPPYLDLLEKGHLSPSQGTELARLDPHDQDTLFGLIRDGRCDTYAKLRAAADALIAAANQGGFFEEKKVSATEAKALSAFESKIEQIVKLVSAGFKDGEVVVLQKINPHRAGIVATQIGLIGKHLKLIEREIQKVVAQGEIA